MKKYTRIYLDGMGHDETDFIPCEMCGAEAKDIHHIDSRGMGSSKGKDTLDNLMALCRTCHVAFGDKEQYKQKLMKIHLLTIEERVV